jgi:hypothetical protein
MPINIRSILISIIFFILSINACSTSHRPPGLKALEATNSLARDSNWLLGSWTGTLPGEEKPRTLLIIDEKDGFKALYGITGGNMHAINITLHDNSVSLITPASTQIVLQQISERQMEGVFQPKGDAKIKNIKFIKDEFAPVALNPLIFQRAWEGDWMFTLKDPANAHTVMRVFENGTILYFHERNTGARLCKVKIETENSFIMTFPSGRKLRFDLRGETLHGVDLQYPHWMIMMNQEK